MGGVGREDVAGGHFNDARGSIVAPGGCIDLPPRDEVGTLAVQSTQNLYRGVFDHVVGD